jgi:hypothetical protein
MKFSTFSINSLIRSASLCGLALSAASCVSGPPYQPDGNVFINDRKPKYGYQGTNSPTDPGATADKPDKPKNDRGEDPSKLHDNGADNGDKPKVDEPKPDKPVTDPAPTPPADEAKPKPPATNLPFGTPVIGKKGFVYSPYAPAQGMVDVSDIPSGTKVECPYTKKIFRVP